jgi:glycosyltransferase involved in cell wall biosynthesis
VGLDLSGHPRTRLLPIPATRLRGCRTVNAVDRPLVSVIIPVHNTGRYLGDSLRSVLAQGYRPIEVIVVDDGSTDDSAKVATSFSEVVCHRQAHQGVPGARNAGIGLSRGDFIAFQDADDLWHPNKLSIQIEWLLEHPTTGYVAAHFRNFLEAGVPRPVWVGEEQLAKDQKGGVPNLVARRSVFDTIGLFDPRQESGSDLDWIIRAKDAKISGEILPHVLLFCRIHASNHSYRWKGGKHLRLRALKASIDRQRRAGKG